MLEVKALLNGTKVTSHVPAGVQVQHVPGETEDLHLWTAVLLQQGAAGEAVRQPRHRHGRPPGHLPLREAQGRQWQVLAPPPGLATPLTVPPAPPQGLAYVEFAREAEASQAVLKMDGVELEGNKISVAISNPPRRTAEPSRTSADLLPRQLYGA